MNLQVLDISYYSAKEKPIVQIFGKLETGKSHTVSVYGFQPYFYGLPVVSNNLEKVATYMNGWYNKYNVKVRIVDRYLPMGYQDHTTKLYLVTYTNPKDTVFLREDMLTQGYITETYEADILFKNRFMIDLGIKGFTWIWIPDFMDEEGKRHNINYRQIKVVE